MLANHVERSRRIGRPRYATPLNLGDPIVGPGAFCAFLTPSPEPPHRPFGEVVRAALAAARRPGVAAGTHAAPTEILIRRVAGGPPGVDTPNGRRLLAEAARTVGGAVETERV